MMRTLDTPKTIRRRRGSWPIWIFVFAVPIGVAICVLGMRWDTRSADERLAEIEAARAIPDSENAAVIYDRLRQDPNASLLLEQVPEFLHPDSNDSELFEAPWKSSDHTDAATWIQAAQPIVDTLIEASRFEQCRFPIEIDDENRDDQMNRNSAMRSWARLLRMAAYNDVAEGRIDAAMAKWICLLQMGKHLRQEPDYITHFTASAIEGIALSDMARYVVEDLPTESQLQRVESMPPSLAKSWPAMEQELDTVEQLTKQKLTESLSAVQGTAFRLVSLYLNFGTDSVRPRRKELIHDKCLADVRALHILIALKRFYYENNRWPEHLHAIRASLSEAILTDPINQGAFVYRQMGDSFRLYSKGVNKRDDDGRREPLTKDGADDWLFWPR